MRAPAAGASSPRRNSSDRKISTAPPLLAEILAASPKHFDEGLPDHVHAVHATRSFKTTPARHAQTKDISKAPRKKDPRRRWTIQLGRERRAATGRVVALRRRGVAFLRAHGPSALLAIETLPRRVELATEFLGRALARRRLVQRRVALPDQRRRRAAGIPRRLLQRSAVVGERGLERRAVVERGVALPDQLRRVHVAVS